MANAPTRSLLGGLAPARFLARHWHKQALLVRGAIPGFAGLFTRDALFALATRDDVESRLVRQERGRYTLDHGPFRKADLQRLPPRRWTLLVSGVNLESDAADALLRRFAFLPYARLDDLMVSYATPGGGVGPHFDSYDVFLLQAFGRRRWRYGHQHDLSLRPGAALKILRRFTPSQDDTLGPGDMLYLPPDYAHDGVAVDECMTYSIGFRAPLYQELAEAFLDHLRDTVELDGRYADPDLAPRKAPACIDARMQRRIAQALSGIRFDAATIARFLGRYLTEPKPLVVFPAPRALSRQAFARRIARDGVALDRRTQLLYDDDRLYVNGDDIAMPRAGRAALRRLADARRLSARDCATLPASTLGLLHDWHRHGFLDDTA
ncbi:MAG TPA: cupin domain-containing protein [Casimicrobiaceae bacterium]|nr:cupin domain-containing protein [Casimicrobiaceae bacterium]